MFNNDWKEILEDTLDSDEFKKLMVKAKYLYDTKTIFPLKKDLFAALKLTSFANTKVVIIGQDPYHGINQAMGLSFSVRKGVKMPPSLKNIFIELYNDLGIKNNTGDLSQWAKEGILLLNTILTVEENKPLSHKDLGWQMFTDVVIKKLNDREDPIVFILWGNNALEKKYLITNNKHLIISSSHPSPFSARVSFFGSKPFSKTNEFLIKNKKTPINWSL